MSFFLDSSAVGEDQARALEATGKGPVAHEALKSEYQGPPKGLAGPATWKWSFTVQTSVTTTVVPSPAVRGKVVRSAG